LLPAISLYVGRGHARRGLTIKVKDQGGYGWSGLGLARMVTRSA